MGFPSRKVLIFFIVATLAFAAATIFLIAQNEQLKSQLKNYSTPNLTSSKEYAKYRLPTSIVPLTYDLYLYPNISGGFFTGDVLMHLKVETKTNEIVMHCNNLDIAKTLINGEPSWFDIDSSYDLLTVKMKDGADFLKGSDVNVTIYFSGNLENKIVGLYKSQYVAEDSTTRDIVTSQLEATHAREVFPCFDEPNFKATFKVHLLKPKDPSYSALSNFPEIGEEDTPDGIMVHFAETVPMSTYLACFIISDFKYTKRSFNNNDGTMVPFRFYATPAQINKTIFAGEFGKEVMEHYIRYFNVSFPLPKLDMIAIPDFQSAGMENWGLVTFREAVLLYDVAIHSQTTKQIIAITVAHELSHSWFGNLVTMKWWDDIWLNEGFATYISFKGIEKYAPDWKIMDQYLIIFLHEVLAADATQATHPIIKILRTTNQISEVFDRISYFKGSCVIRMLESVVNEDNFQKGVSNYLRRYKFGNTVTMDLWNEIQDTVGDMLNVSEFMDTYTRQIGYPILQATVKGSSYVFTQKRFLTDYNTAKKQKKSPFNYKWTVPVTFVTNLGLSDRVYWFNYKAEKLIVEKPAGAKWIKFNPNHVGYYRVNYSENDWNTLTSNIKTMSLSDKTHLIEESFSIAESGELNYKIPLNLTKYLVDEINYNPWKVAADIFNKLKRHLRESRYNSEFKSYVVRLLKPAYEKLTWKDTDETESHIKKLARDVILNLACEMDYDVALKQAAKYIDDWLHNKWIHKSHNVRSIIYKFGMVYFDEEKFFRMFEIYTREKDSTEKVALLTGLANVRHPMLLKKLIDATEDENYVRSQDQLQLLVSISKNPVGEPIVWDYVRDHWPDLVEKFDLQSNYLGKLIPAVTNGFSAMTKLEEMKQFFEKYPDAGAGKISRAEALEHIFNSIKWNEKYWKVVEEWIRENV